MSFIAINKEENLTRKTIPNRKHKVGINGFGIIGKIFFMLHQTMPELRKSFDIDFIVDIDESWQDHANIVNNHSLYGYSGIDLTYHNNKYYLTDGNQINLFSSVYNANIEDVDFLVDASGDSNANKVYFENLIEKGAKKVIFPNFNKNLDFNLIIGFNEKDIKLKEAKTIGCGSCSMNLIVPILGVIEKEYAINSLFTNVLHAINGDQSSVDRTHSKTSGTLKRASGSNFMVVPSGSLKNISQFIPSLNGNIDAINTRIPVSVGMAMDTIVTVDSETTVQEITRLFKDAEKSEHRGIIKVVDEKNGFSSSQTRGMYESSILDSSKISVIDKNQIRIFAWQDPYMGFSNRIWDIICQLSSFK